jgi:putative aminopeptidase FrvX
VGSERPAMQDEQLNFLKQLVEAHGGPGYEQGVQSLYKQRLDGHADQITTDRLGSVIAVRNPQGKVRVLLDGHSDEIAFVVRYIDDNGFLFVAASGGWDEEVIVGQRVIIHTAKGPVAGVFGKKAIHLMDPEERKKKSEIHNLWIDIGALNGAEAKETVEIGDSVTMNAVLTPVLNGRAISKAFDNRAGIYCVSETLRSLSKNHQAAVFGVSAVQEEIGLRGAQAATYACNPHVGIAIDVSHALDIPDSNKRKAGEVKVGGGPVIVRGPNVNPKVFRRLVDLAKQHEIPHQIAASGIGTGTDANVMQLSREGVATGLVAIPLRYMHSPGEMISLEDLDHVVKLLTVFVESVVDEDDWTP